MKAATKWRREDGAALAELAETKRIQRALGVYRGEQALKIGKLLVLPVEEFLRRLAAGEVLR